MQQMVERTRVRRRRNQSTTGGARIEEAVEMIIREFEIGEAQRPDAQRHQRVRYSLD